MAVDRNARRKSSETNYDHHNRWKKYIRADHPQLTKGINRGVLIGYVQLLADGGGHGIRCFTADETIAAEMELSRNTVAKYKKEALRIGWLEATGEHGPHNAPIFAIAIPEHDVRPLDPTTKVTRKTNLGKFLNDGTRRKPTVAVEADIPPWLDDPEPEPYDPPMVPVETPSRPVVVPGEIVMINQFTKLSDRNRDDITCHSRARCGCAKCIERRGVDA